MSRGGGSRGNLPTTADTIAVDANNNNNSLSISGMDGHLGVTIPGPYALCLILLQVLPHSPFGIWKEASVRLLPDSLRH